MGTRPIVSSLAWNYQFPRLPQVEGLVGPVPRSGWQLSGTTILCNRAHRLTSITNAAFAPMKDANGTFTGYGAGQWRLLNADGEQFEGFPGCGQLFILPNKPGRSYLQGAFPPRPNFPRPGPPLAQTGTNATTHSANPVFAPMGYLPLLKNTAITERVNFQLRI